MPVIDFTPDAKENTGTKIDFTPDVKGVDFTPDSSLNIDEPIIPRNGLERAASNYQQERAAGLIPGSDAGTVMHQEPNTLMGQLQESLLDDVLPTAKVKPEDSKAMAVGKEIYNLATGIPKFSTSPVGIAAAVGSVVSAPVVTAIFTADMLKSLGKQAIKNHADWDKMTPGQKAGAVTQMVGTGGFMALLGTHLKEQVRPNLDLKPKGDIDPLYKKGVVEYDAIRSVAPLTAEALKQTTDESLKPRENIQPEEPNASSIETPTEIHGDVRQQSEQVQAEMPVNEGVEGVQPQAQEEIVDQPVNKDAQPELIGMGGAVPSEFERGKGNPTSNKNEVVDKERQQRGLPEMMTTLRQTWGEAWTKAMAKIDEDPAYQDRLVAELNDKPRPITDTENAALLHRRVDLRNEYDKSIKATAQALDDGRLDAMAESKLQTAYWSDKLTELENATKGGGSETGRALAARKMLMNEDFSLASLELQKRAANDFRPLTDNERTELKQLADDYKAKNDALEKHLAEQQERTSQAESARAIAEAKVDAAKGPQIDPFIVKIAEKIGQGLKSNADAARERIKARLGKVTFGSGPLHEIPNIKDYAIIGAEHIYSIGLDFAKWSARMVGEFGDDIKPHLKDLFELSKKEVEGVGEKSSGSKDQAKKVQKSKQTFDEQKQAFSDSIAEKVKSNQKYEITGQVQRLARLLVQNGVTDREKLIDAVHSVLKDSMPEITRRETMDAISGYGDFKQLSKDAISIQLRGLKGEMQQLAKLEDMANGQPPLKSGVERRTPTEAERKLIQAVNEAKFKFQVPSSDPATQLQSALDTVKKTLANRAKDLQDRLDRGDFEKKPRRELQLDSEAIRLKAEAERVRRKFEAGLELDRRSKLTRGQRILEAIPKWSRAVLLSGPSTLAKLTFAAIETMAIKPIEETAGYAIGKVIPKVAEKARVEGGLNLKAESRAITQGIVKGMRESWNILRKGSSNLDEAMGKDKGMPREMIEFFGQVHGALKTVPKQAAFERTLQKLNDHDAARGVDITDPMVQTKNIAQAYKEANKAIFMEDNRVVNAYKAALHTLEAKGKSPNAPLSARVGASAIKTLLPIVKIPTNLVARTMEYAIGSVTGSVRLAKAMSEGMENLTPEQADLIMSNLKKGSLGAAVLLLGYFNADKVGGYYQHGQKQKPGEPKYGSILVNGHQIPSLLLHNPLLETLQIGATIRHVAESKIKASEDEKRGLGSGTMAGLLGLVEETPFVRETTEVSKLLDPNQRDQFLNELVKSRVVPQIIIQTAEFLDKDSEGNKIKRKPENMGQAIESGIPGLRERVPVKR